MEEIIVDTEIEIAQELTHPLAEQSFSQACINLRTYPYDSRIESCRIESATLRLQRRDPTEFTKIHFLYGIDRMQGVLRDAETLVQVAGARNTGYCLHMFTCLRACTTPMRRHRDVVAKVPHVDAQK